MCLWLENLLFSLCILNHKHLASRTQELYTEGAQDIYELTFVKSIGGHKEEWELEEDFTVDEGLEPGRWRGHYGVPELLQVPLKSVQHLKK